MERKGPTERTRGDYWKRRAELEQRALRDTAEQLQAERASHEKTRAELRDARCGAEVAARRQVADAIAPLEADRARLERELAHTQNVKALQLAELLAVPWWIRRVFRPRA